MTAPPQVIRLNADSFPLLPAERTLYKDACCELLTRESMRAADLSAYPSTTALCVVSAKVNAEMIDHLPSLQVISRFGSGVDNIDFDAATRRGVLVTNVPHFCLTEVADHTMALLLASARRLLEMDRATRTGKWRARTEIPTRRVASKQLGLIGFGRIAQEVAIRAAAFGLRVQASDPQMDVATARRLSVEPVSLESLLASSHFVSLHVPLTAQTRHLIGRDELRRMREDAVLINTARGAVVDEPALVEALRNGWIAGAALDVYEGLDMFGPAPEVVHHPLMELPNVILTPHSAGCSEEALEELLLTGARQAIDVLLGLWPANCINPEVTPVRPLSRVPLAPAGAER